MVFGVELQKKGWNGCMFGKHLRILIYVQGLLLEALGIGYCNVGARAG
jgi:hypothetical protein